MNEVPVSIAVAHALPNTASASATATEASTTTTNANSNANANANTATSTSTSTSAAPLAVSFSCSSTISSSSCSSAASDNTTNNTTNNNNNNTNTDTDTPSKNTKSKKKPARERAHSITRRRFAECALIEIIHLHDCLRGSLFEIQTDVQTLVDSASFITTSVSVDTYSNNNADTDTDVDTITQTHTNAESNSNSTSTSNCTPVTEPKQDTTDKFEIHVASDLSNSVASRFHLIWSVFQAHSGAEDEFIWPALKMKIESKKSSSTSTSGSTSTSTATSTATPTTTNKKDDNAPAKKCGCESFLEQDEYEEDHAAEETMFKQIHTTLRRLNGSFRYYHANVKTNNDSTLNANTNNNNNNYNNNNTNNNTNTNNTNNNTNPAVDNTTSTTTTKQSCLTIIKNVIYQLKEQTDNLTQHLIQHLEKEETQCLPMVQKHLSNDEISNLVGNIMGQRSADVMSKILNLAVCALPSEEREDMVSHMKKAMVGTFFEKWLTMGGWNSTSTSNHNNNNALSLNSNKDKDQSILSSNNSNNSPAFISSSKRSLDTIDEYNLPPAKIKKIGRHHTDARLRYPSRYYVKKNDQISLVWNSMDADSVDETSISIPQFTISELTPTYHFNEKKGNLVLGCEHYMRECKLRHPSTGELYTCRLCCEEIKQSHRYRDVDLPQLDRFKVTEVLCMKCRSVQPAGKICCNTDCESHINGIPFANHYCDICHLYDNSGTSIYHCPFCNVCRKGQGLGIDFRHCMRCNACVSMTEKHKCIPQRLQGNCPICHEDMFESTQPLRGLKCGHVMHLSCFNEYTSRATLGRLTCPLCKLSFDNMRG